MGNVRITKMGFSTELMSPRMKDKSSAVTYVSTVTPGNK